MLMFARAHFLLLLLLVPLILLGYAVLRGARRRRIRRFGDETLVAALMPSWSSAKGWWRTVLARCWVPSSSSVKPRAPRS